jgi:hypothetical protein
VAHEWTDDDARVSHDRAVNELIAILTRLSEGRQVTIDSAMSADVQRRDAQMWDRVERGASAS